MVAAVFRLLPLVARAQQPPRAALFGAGVLDMVLGLQFAGQEFTPQTHFVGDPDGFPEALGPHGNDLFDHRPGADRANPYLLVPMELSLGHHASLSSFTTQEGDTESLTAGQFAKGPGWRWERSASSSLPPVGRRETRHGDRFTVGY